MTGNKPKRLIKQLSSLLAFTGLLFLLAPSALAANDPFIGVKCSWNTSGQLNNPCATSAPLAQELKLFSVRLMDDTVNTDYTWTTITLPNNTTLTSYTLGDGTVMHCKDGSYGDFDFSRSCALIETNNNQQFPVLTFDCAKQYGNLSTEGRCRIAPRFDTLSSNISEPPPLNIRIMLKSFILSCYGTDPAPFCSNLTNVLLSGSGNIQGLIRSMLPLNPEAAIDMSYNSQRGGARAIQQRLTRLRTGNGLASNIETGFYLANNQWLKAGTRLAANDTVANDAAPEKLTVDSSISALGRLGVFVNASVIDGKYDAGSISSQSDSKAAILTIGVDYRFTDDLVLGVATNIGQSKVEYQNTVSGKIEADNYDLIGYTSWYKGNWFIDGALTLGIDHYEQLRDPSAVNNSYEAKYKGNRYDLSGSAGYEFVMNAFNIAPYVKASVGRLNTDAYDERKTDPGALGPPGMVIDEQKRDTGSVSAGSYFRYVVTTSHGVFIPLLTLTAVHDFETEAQQVTGRYVNLAGNSSGFVIDTEETDANYFVVAAGMSFQLKNGNSGFFNVETLEGYDNLDQNRLTLGWRWEL